MDPHRGGVDFGFTSTSHDYEMAAKYARQGGARMIFECQMGIADRGAEITWLSQYPAEEEVCLPPLTAFEVMTATKMVEVPLSQVILEPCTESNLLEMLRVDTNLDPLPKARGPAVNNLHALARTLKGGWERIASDAKQRGLPRAFVTMRQPLEGGGGAPRLVGVVDGWTGAVVAVAADCAVYEAGLKLDDRIIAIDGHVVTRDMLTALTDARIDLAAKLAEGKRMLRLTASYNDTEVRDDLLVVRVRVSCSASRSSTA